MGKNSKNRSSKIDRIAEGPYWCYCGRDFDYPDGPADHASFLHRQELKAKKVIVCSKPGCQYPVYEAAFSDSHKHAKAKVAAEKKVGVNGDAGRGAAGRGAAGRGGGAWYGGQNLRSAMRRY